MKFNFNLFKKEYGLQMKSRRVRTEPVQGYTNRCNDGRFVVLIDYDIKILKWIRQEIIYLQHTYELGEFHLFKTGNGYHAVCLDKVTLQELITILNVTSADHNFVNVPLRYGAKLWTLRFSKKDKKQPEYVETISSKYNEQRMKSAPHTKLLQTLYGEHKITTPKDKLLDNERTMVISTYNW